MASTVIVGAGAFGGSLAWWLARAGREVTLVDQFAPGDARATSGGESRLIRCGHGPDPHYTASARRARTLWRELEAECGEELMVECGVCWFVRRDDGWEAEAATVLAAQGIPHERLDPGEGARLYPSFDARGLAFLLLEPEAGVLRAQRATRALARQAAAHGATVLQAGAQPEADRVRLDDGRVLEADTVVWACGPWLGRLFPDVVDIASTCQELYFFGVGPAWRTPGVPAYVDFEGAIYGTGDLDGLGVKAAPDLDGPPLDPDAPLPAASGAGEARSREFLRERFPALGAAQLVASKCCRYELSTDSHFVATRHPGHPRVWLYGGGSGHGFKHGPSLAEQMTAALDGGRELPARFGLGLRTPGRALRTSGAIARE